MRRPRLSIRRKLLLFAVAIAVVPLLVAGRAMIRIAEDELKSSANEQLLSVATQLARETNDTFERTWLGPIVLIRNAIDDQRLGMQEKVALLTHGIADLADIVALQITVEGTPLPLVVTQDGFSDHLRGAGLDPLDVLRVPPERVSALGEEDVYAQDVTYVRASDDWLATIVLPLRSEIAGLPASLSARVDLHRLSSLFTQDPFNQTGFITIVDRDGRHVFDPLRTDLRRYALVDEAIGAMSSESRSVAVAPYTRPDGEVMLGAFAFPRPFDWAVLVERRQSDAYLAVEAMIRNLLFWGALGLGVAVLGAVALAVAISRPILEIDRIATKVASGDLTVRVVHGLRQRDEIGDLARRINAMIIGLGERLQLEKFVSGGTLAAIKLSEDQGVRLGGERRRATMLFCDIRGYTAFAENHEPDIVVEVLNFYFLHLTAQVKRHHGDIDKFVGDQILALFTTGAAEENALRCAVAMQATMRELGAGRPDWNLAVGIGVNSGEVIMGAMGSPERMDYTVLGDAVNLAARLCASAPRGQVLATRVTCSAIGAIDGLVLTSLPPMTFKGKSTAVPVLRVWSTDEVAEASAQGLLSEGGAGG